MRAIVAVDNDCGIGKDNDLLFKIPEDLKMFKKLTLYNTVVMGRNTYESLPNKRPLENRFNIVISRNPDYTISSGLVFNDLYTLFHMNIDPWIIGGESIYKLALPYCEEIYMTRIYDNFGADRFFPDISKMKNWVLEYTSDIRDYNGVGYAFTRWKNTKVNKFKKTRKDD
jgi:dihydrofolate reductase